MCVGVCVYYTGEELRVKGGGVADGGSLRIKRTREERKRERELPCIFIAGDGLTLRFIVSGPVTDYAWNGTGFRERAPPRILKGALYKALVALQETPRALGNVKYYTAAVLPPSFTLKLRLSLSLSLSPALSRSLSPSWSLSRVRVRRPDKRNHFRCWISRWRRGAFAIARATRLFRLFRRHRVARDRRLKFHKQTWFTFKNGSFLLFIYLGGYSVSGLI